MIRLSGNHGDKGIPQLSRLHHSDDHPNWHSYITSTVINGHNLSTPKTKVPRVRQQYRQRKQKVKSHDRCFPKYCYKKNIRLKQSAWFQSEHLGCQELLTTIIISMGACNLSLTKLQLEIIRILHSRIRSTFDIWTEASCK